MTATPDDQPGFAPDEDAPIPYMARTREYYAAIGYTTPYRWAHYVGAPKKRGAISPTRRSRASRWSCGSGNQVPLSSADV